MPGEQLDFLIISKFKNIGDVPFFLKEILEELGHSVTLWGLDLDTDIITNHLKDNAFFLHWPEGFIRRVHSKRLWKYVKHKQPDILFFYDTNWYIEAEALKKIKSKTNTRIIIWEGNLRFWERHQFECLKYYDIIFVGDSYIIPLLTGPMGRDRVYHMKGPGLPQVYKPWELSEKEKALFSADAAFLGTASEHRLDFFEQLAGLIPFTFKLWGPAWNQSPKLKKFHQDYWVATLEKIKIFTATKINLDYHAGRNHQINNFSTRVYEIPLCDGFVLTEYRSDLEKFFKIGEEIEVFHNVNDAGKKIEYYLKHPEERKEMVKKCKEKILNHYTLSHTVNKILDIINEKL